MSVPNKPLNSKQPILITGSGAVCSAGHLMEDIWKAVTTGQVGIGPIQQWDASRWPASVAAEVTSANKRTLVEDRKLHKMISRTDMFGLYAAKVAVEGSGLSDHQSALEGEEASAFSDRSAVFAGSGGGAYQSSYDFLPLLTEVHRELPGFGRELTATVNPMWLLRNLPNNVVCHVGIRHGFKGTNGCVTNQCVGGAQAIVEAAESIQCGEADRAIAVGHDAPLEPQTLLHFHRLGLLANDLIRPFDKDHNGTVLGEGAAALVLERADHAAARNAPVLGEYLGSGCSSEATGVVGIRPDGTGLSEAIQKALAEAGLTPADIGLVVAHGNGTRASDASEARAIDRVFQSDPPPVTGFKWAFGHPIAASANLDCAMALLALRNGTVPGIATFNTQDPAIPNIPVSNQTQSPRTNIALVLCRGFGGMNIALLLRGPAPK